MNIGGFGDPNNIHIYTAGILDGYLYAGTRNKVTGGQIWRYPDGTTWIPANIDGFGDPNTIGTYPYLVSGDNLYVGALNYVTGAEVWTSSDGIYAGHRRTAMDMETLIMLWYV